MINGIIAWSVTYRRTVLTALFLLFIAGFYSWFAIPRESQPDVPIPWAYVGVRHEGISPQDAERLIVRTLENELRGLEGMKQMIGSATEAMRACRWCSRWAWT
jgi:multidrug efflux pump